MLELALAQGQVVPELRIAGVIAGCALELWQCFGEAALGRKRNAKELTQDGGAGE